MAIAGAEAITMVDFDHISVSGARTSPHDNSGRGRCYDGPPGTTEIDAGVKSDTVREGIDARAEATGDLELGAMDRRRERHMVQRAEERIQLFNVGCGT